MVKVKSRESVPFLRYSHFYNVSHIIWNIRVIAHDTGLLSVMSDRESRVYRSSHGPQQVVFQGGNTITKQLACTYMYMYRYMYSADCGSRAWSTLCGEVGVK